MQFRGVLISPRLREGLGPLGVHGDAHHAALRGPEFPVVDVHGCSVGEEDVVRGEVGLRGGVSPVGAGVAVGASAGRVHAVAVAQYREGLGLVEGDPVFHSVAEGAEAGFGVYGEIGPGRNLRCIFRVSPLN